MHDEAVLLPKILGAAGIDDAILVGHSDGGSIAILAAASARALVLMAPHVFVEDESITAITEARENYDPLRPRLARHHHDVDNAFYGWNRAWLDPGFREWNIEVALPDIRVPTLVIQGADDPYGTLAQVDAVERGSGGPVQRLLLADCGHSPHREQPAATVAAIARFVAEL